jgi:hypothetical protein
MRMQPCYITSSRCPKTETIGGIPLNMWLITINHLGLFLNRPTFEIPKIARLNEKWVTVASGKATYFRCQCCIASRLDGFGSTTQTGHSHTTCASIDSQADRTFWKKTATLLEDDISHYGKRNESSMLKLDTVTCPQTSATQSLCIAGQRDASVG